jgi:hypothetical protein
MKNILLIEHKKIAFDIKAMINAYPMASDKKHMYNVCKNLVVFSENKKLFIKTFVDQDGNISRDLIIYESDLTELGKTVFNDLIYDWLAYTDNLIGKIGRVNNIKMLEKYFNKTVK